MGQYSLYSLLQRAVCVLYSPDRLHDRAGSISPMPILTLVLTAGSRPDSVSFVRSEPRKSGFRTDLPAGIMAGFLRGFGGDLNGFRRLDVERVRCGTPEELDYASAGVDGTREDTGVGNGVPASPCGKPCKPWWATVQGRSL